MDFGLQGKTVLITGATRNHGRASALAFAEEGSNLLLCTRQSMDLLEETAQMVSGSGVKVVTAQCDVTDEEQVNSLIQKGLSEFGHVDVVVNNAAWRHAVGVNVHAPFLMCRAVIPSMVNNRWGRIINYSGIAPFRGASGQGTLKLACEGLTRAIATEYGKYNITANCIGPGSIDVTRTQGQENHPGAGGIELDNPVPRQGTVEECSAVVVFLASDGARYITGQTYLVNGGAHYL